MYQRSRFCYRRNKNEYIIIIRSPWFTLGDTLGVAHSVDLGKPVVYIHHHFAVAGSDFTAYCLQIICALPVLSFLLLNPWQPLIFFFFFFFFLLYPQFHLFQNFIELKSQVLTLFFSGAVLGLNSESHA
jgi:hypothetical protein